MIIKIAEISSGFGNIPNTCIFGDGHEYSDRPGSAYDCVHNCILPDGFTTKAYTMYGGNLIVHYPTDESGRIFDNVYVKNDIIHIMASDGTDYKLKEAEQ